MDDDRQCPRRDVLKWVDLSSTRRRAKSYLVSGQTKLVYSVLQEVSAKLVQIFDTTNVGI